MEEIKIYDNGEIKLKHGTNISYKDEKLNKFKIGFIGGQENNNFKVFNPRYETYDLVAQTQIDMVEIEEDGEPYFIKVEEYKEIK